MDRLRQLLAVAALLGTATACGPRLPTIQTACGQLPLEDRTASSASQCGPTLDLTPVNRYQGELSTAVQEAEDAVALIGGSCTGTLIAAAAGPVVLTAGHCSVNVGDRFLVSFNVEENPDGDQLTTEGAVIERADEPDYALLQLDALPSVTPALLTSQTSALLAVIQHPRGGPKAVADGQYLGACNGVIYYANLDTLVGSSGAGVITRHGHLTGVHTDGDCMTDGNGANRGWSSASIVDASAYLVDGDIADR